VTTARTDRQDTTRPHHPDEIAERIRPSEHIRLLGEASPAHSEQVLKLLSRELGLGAFRSTEPSVHVHNEPKSPQ
jgi:hypothetical protein